MSFQLSYTTYSLPIQNIFTKTGNFSLNIRTVGELLDMYHIREAFDRRDKVYALLGMASDNYGINALFANYEITWEALFKQVITFILNKPEIIMTCDDKEMTIIKNKCCLLGTVSSVESASIWDDKREISIALTNESAYSNVKMIMKGKPLKGRWVL